MPRPNQGFTSYLMLRVTDSDMQVIHEAAARCDLTPAAFVRGLVHEFIEPPVSVLPLPGGHLSAFLMSARGKKSKPRRRK
jgi:hypothetical protein